LPKGDRAQSWSKYDHEIFEQPLTYLGIKYKSKTIPYISIYLAHMVDKVYPLPPHLHNPINMPSPPSITAGYAGKTNTTQYAHMLIGPSGLRALSWDY
jgi:hypothetical protein